MTSLQENYMNVSPSRLPNRFVLDLPLLVGDVLLLADSLFTRMASALLKLLEMIINHNVGSVGEAEV